MQIQVHCVLEGSDQHCLSWNCPPFPLLSSVTHSHSLHFLEELLGGGLGIGSERMPYPPGDMKCGETGGAHPLLRIERLDQVVWLSNALISLNLLLYLFKQLRNRTVKTEKRGREEEIGCMCLKLQGHKPGRVGCGISLGHKHPFLVAGCQEKGGILDFRVRILVC